jgi:AcrR family transcriptional regulator
MEVRSTDEAADVVSVAPFAVRSVERTLAPKYSAYAEEVDRLIRAGLAVMERADTANPRVSEIVEEAGLSNQSFYRHFRSKDELLLAIIDDGQRRLVGYLKHQMAKEPSGLDKVARWVEGIMSQAIDPVAAKATRGVALTRDRLRAEFAAESRSIEELIEAPLRAALTLAAEQGEIPAGDPERDAKILFRLAVRNMELLVIDRETPSPADIEHLLGFVRAAVGGTHPVVGKRRARR